jgi:hypothetical protein
MRTAATGVGSRAGSAASFEGPPGAAQLDLRGCAARDSDSARAGSGVPSKDKRGLIDPARPPTPVAHAAFYDWVSSHSRVLCNIPLLTICI